MQEAAKYRWFGVARNTWPPPQRKQGAPAPPAMPAEPSHPSSSLQDGGGIGSEGRFRLWQGGYLALPLACALLPQCGVPGKLVHS